MKLWEVETQTQMLEALKANDKELLNDLRRAVEKEVDRAWEHATYDTEFLDIEELADVMDNAAHGSGWGALVESLEEVGGAGVRGLLLDDVPEERLHDAIREALADALIRAGGRDTLFEVTSDARCGYGRVELKPIYADLHVSFTDPSPLAWVPKDVMAQLLNDVVEAEWGHFPDGSWASGWVETPDSLWAVPNATMAYEWVMDQRRAWIEDLLENNRDQANKLFMSEIKSVDPQLHKKLKKAKLPSDVLASYALVWLEAGDDRDERAEALVVLREAVGIFGYEGSRAELIVEVDRDVLRSLGITEGKWWDRAPWRLVNLPPEELSYEGTIQRHCVGRHDMGYREAVERGDTQIWSLRSAFNKPVLTWEIDLNRWRSADPEDARYDPRVTDPAMERGLAVRQLKGFSNRASATTPQEALVLGWLFHHLGIDPRYVRDAAMIRLLTRGPQDNPEGFNAPWLPYGVRDAKARCLVF